MEELDTLTLQIGPIEENTHFDVGACFLVTALINGKPLPDVLDIDEFFLALQAPSAGSGKKRSAPVTHRLPIFNCSCGGFGCGGFYVDVTITPDALIWENFACAKTEARTRYAFAWSNVREVIEELLATIYTAQAQSPNGEVRYGVTGVEVTERLPFYLERYEALSQARHLPDASH